MTKDYKTHTQHQYRNGTAFITLHIVTIIKYTRLGIRQSLNVAY